MDDEGAAILPKADGAPAPAPGVMRLRIPRWKLICTAILSVVLLLISSSWWGIAQAVFQTRPSWRHFYIVRHGDKLEDCLTPEGRNKGKEFQNNCPLTRQGWDQAAAVAAWLQDKDVGMVLASPFLRTQQTALATARALGLPIFVDYRLSEQRLPDGPHRLYNSKLRAPGVAGEDQGTAYMGHQTEIRRRRAPRLPFPTFEIWTPEGDAEYYERVVAAVRDYQRELRGNVAIFTHSMVAWSLFYGLSEAVWTDPSNALNRTSPLPPAGVFHVALNPRGLPEVVEGPLAFALQAFPRGCTGAHRPVNASRFWPP